MIQTRSLVSKVLAVLSDGSARAPADLARLAGAPKDAVEAALHELEGAGLRLRWESSGRTGIAQAFIALDQATIDAALADLGCPAEVRIEAMLGSTNTALLQRARATPAAAQPEGLSVLATELQTAGRGRQGRTWSAQAGSSLTVSYARALSLGLSELSGLSLTCGLAVRDALGSLGVTLALKWPNDLIWQGRKLGGILIEVHPVAARRCVAVIGVGLNVAADPARSAALAQHGTRALESTDLVAAGAQAPVDRNQLIAQLARALTDRLDQFLASGFEPCMADWNAHHAYQDQPVEMVEGERVVYRGIARGVDAKGRLCLQTPGGVLALLAGDISLRPGHPEP